MNDLIAALELRSRFCSWFAVVLLTGVLAPVTALALPDDREQPIHITADKAVRDERQGVTIYSGNVQMRQGSMELDADSLTIYHEQRDADKIVAEGAPAKMRQQPEIDSGLVHAHADVITYFRDQELVHLRTRARLERDDGTLVTGDSIDYFISRELVKAESDRNNSGNKVFVVIPPSLVNEDSREAAAPQAVDSTLEDSSPEIIPAGPSGSPTPASGAADSTTESMPEPGES